VHLVDVLIAASLLAAVCASLPAAFAGAARANLAAGETTRAVVMATQKVEELRTGPFPGPGSIESSDLLDASGRVAGESGSRPAFRRMWRTQPLAAAPDHTVVITVVVAPYHRSVRLSLDVPTGGATRLVTLRSWKAP
jgi:hypothetical protein